MPHQRAIPGMNPLPNPAGWLIELHPVGSFQASTSQTLTLITMAKEVQ